MISIQVKPEEDTNWLKYIHIQENVLDPDVCDRIIHFGQEHSKRYSRTTWNSNFKACSLPIDHFVHDRLGKYWENSILYFNASVDFVEQYEVKCYTKLDFFDNHFDNLKNTKAFLDRKLTCSIQLSDSNQYGCGDLSIMNIKVPKERGTMVVFPSAMTHRVDRVTKGERWALVNWAWGPIV